jgi:cytochrome c peroxidase
MELVRRTIMPRRAGAGRMAMTIALAAIAAIGPAASEAATSPGGSPERAEIDLRALRRIEHPPLGLPAVPVPVANRPTVATIHLGRKLFLDRRLSRNGTLSCAMCHVPEQGFTVNELRTAVGFEGRSLRRNAPTLLNVAYAGPYFHDGREPELELQPFDVLTNPDEMAAPSLGALVETVRSLPDYRPLFAKAFGGAASVETIGRAIATYLRTLVSARSPFDRFRYGKEARALSESAQRGFALFTGKARCATCHLVRREHALLTDGLFHDTGIAWFAATVGAKRTGPVTVEVAPGESARVPRAVVESVGEPPRIDLGRYEATGDPADRFRIKTPSLRNVALTAPYMHDGSISTLREVVVFYNQGAYPHDGLDPALGPLGLDDRDLDDLVALLQSFTGDNLDELVRDARSEAIGNVGEISIEKMPYHRADRDPPHRPEALEGEAVAAVACPAPRRRGPRSGDLRVTAWASLSCAKRPAL